MKNEQQDEGRSTVEPLGGGRLGEFMTVEDVADMLRINKSTVYRMAKGGRIPHSRDPRGPAMALPSFGSRGVPRRRR